MAADESRCTGSCGVEVLLRSFKVFILSRGFLSKTRRGGGYLEARELHAPIATR